MIIQNGTIEVKQKRGGGVDSETGHPVVKNYTWGRHIPCQYIPISHDKRATYNGEHYTQASYTVLVEEQPFCTTGEQVRLTDEYGRVIGEYPIASIEYLEAVCETKLVI